MVKKLCLKKLLESFNNYLNGLGKENKYDYFGRDPIIAALNSSCKTLIPPIKKLLTSKELDIVNQYYCRTDLVFNKPGTYEMVNEEKVRLIETFINYIKSEGYQKYIFYSENFYDDINDEEEKAFKIDVNQNFRNFISREQVGLMGACDTIVFTEDFTKILILFHHGFYELYNKEFAINFIDYIDSIEMTEKLENVNYKKLMLLDKLKELFFNYLDDKIVMAEILNYIFEQDDLCNIFSRDDYEALFRINTNHLGNRYELSRILFKYYSLAEYEKRSLINKLNEAKNNPQQLPEILREFHSLYYSGYYFLEKLSFWGLADEIEEWDSLNDIQREKWM